MNHRPLSLFPLSLFLSRHKQDNDTFDLALESFINNMSLADKYDFVSIVTALESKNKQIIVEWRKWELMFICLDATYSLFPEIPKQLSRFSSECHQFSFDVVFGPIQSLLSGFSKSSVRDIRRRLILNNRFVLCRIGLMKIKARLLLIYLHTVLFHKKISPK